jgi:phosphoglycolate phosphatase
LRLVVFDLDGTLIDGYAAIGDALGYAMTRLGLVPPSLAAVRAMVGHGLERLIAEAAGEHNVVEGVRLFRQRYPDVAVSKSDLLPGVTDVLATLDARGFALALASNKPPDFSRLILEAKGVARYFRAIEGPGADMPAKPDSAMLRRAMAQTGAEPSTTLVVGDMEVDSEFGRAGGCAVALIASGSRTRKELEATDADVLFDDIGELPAWLAERG